MSPSEFAYWQRAHRRVASLQPDMIAAVLAAFANIRATLSEAQLARLIASGALEAVVTQAIADVVLDRAFAPIRNRVRITTERGFQFATATLPRGGVVNGQIAVAFDTLAPNVVTAIRTLETTVLTTLKADVKEVVRAYVENGIRDGVNPRTIARGIRDVIGLGPSQEQEVRNFRAALEGREGRNPFTYTARDKRYDASIRKGNLTAEKIDKMVDVYRKRRIALNAEAVSRTSTLQSFKAGQRLSWEQAIEQGVVGRGRLKKQRIGVNDDRERPEHVAINDEVRDFDEPYSNGEMVSGDASWGCRCLDRYFVARAS